LKKLAMFLNVNHEIFLSSEDDRSGSKESQNPSGWEIHRQSSDTDNNSLLTEEANSKLHAKEHREKLTAMKEIISRRISRRANQYMRDTCRFDECQLKNIQKSLASESDEVDTSRSSTAPIAPQINPLDTKEKLKQNALASVFDPSNEGAETGVDEATFKNTNEFVNTPCPKGKLYRTFIIRERKGFLSQSVFKVYSSNTNNFLMISKKQTKGKTSKYLISTDISSVIDKQAESFVGKLRSNFWGTEFVLYNRGQETQQCAGVPNSVF